MLKFRTHRWLCTPARDHSRGVDPASCEPDVASIGRFVHLRFHVLQQVRGFFSVGELARVRGFGDRGADMRRDFARARERGVEAALLEIGFADQMRELVCGRHEDFVGDLRALPLTTAPSPMPGKM